MASVIVTICVETLTDDLGRIRIVRGHIEGSDKTLFICGLAYPEDDE